MKLRISRFALPARYSTLNEIKLLNKNYQADNVTNISAPIIQKLESNLLKTLNHPLKILKDKIDTYFTSTFSYKILDSMNPIVTTKQNFDDLLINKDHPGRKPTDTYYINQGLVLRTHTSAHQSEALASKAADGYILSADVYRRDEIDPTHYPVFHQMEGIRLFSKKELATLKLPNHEMETLSREGDNPIQSVHDSNDVDLVARHLRTELEGLMKNLFHQELQIRWIKAYFPFTSPSWEMEIFYNNEWLEVLGCGVIQQEILQNAGVDKVGWAFGIGLERIAMDERFLNQFKDGEISEFSPFSKYPSCYKDVSFWVNNEIHENDFVEVVRTVCGDLVERVALIDTFVHPKTKKTSNCFRIDYRSMDRNLTNKEVDSIHAELCDAVVQKFGVELR
ncbi:hypothetical protein HDV01_005947 [Terramyces sp. JEL0728]|nr:hypothetical protein HDV01_005947 [Terramyces sp. JEL0728]